MWGFLYNLHTQLTVHVYLKYNSNILLEHRDKTNQQIFYKTAVVGMFTTNQLTATNKINVLFNGLALSLSMEIISGLNSFNLIVFFQL